ncbi:MAG: hypothetical protein Q8P30_03765 [Candidatus Uhrbacteria bacterium]|nr:hypothetical protein [Candidatus Uhrbacteria bacterium]
MILLHRITTFLIAAIVAAGFGIIIYYPEWFLHVIVIWCVLVPFFIARLLKWDFKRFSFWVFFSTPVVFLASSILFFLFLEQDIIKIILAIIVSIGLWLYVENLFAFYHLPSAYQAYSLEYLTLVLYILSGFFFTSGAYGGQLFLQLPIWIPSLAVFCVTLFAAVSVFWVSKISAQIGLRFAVVVAILMTELYIALAMLPTSFLTNAAVFAMSFYLLLGLSRAHVLDKLSKKLLKRYVIVAIVLLLIVFGTARWV